MKATPLAAVAGVCLLAVGIVALLLWSTASVDQLSKDRQRRLVENVLVNSSARIAYEQESVTVWDDPLRILSQPELDLVWLDADLGIWMHDYYGHDATFVLGPSDQSLYGMIAGKRAAPEEFARVRGAILPLVRELRAKMRSGSQEYLKARQLSPGVADTLTINGHPAIVSVKPIVSDTGAIEQTPGSEFVHISIRWLDGSFVNEIREQYGFTKARFSTSPRLGEEESSQPLRSRSGAVIGYFVWHHFAPGAAVFARLAPVLLAVFAFIAALVLVLMRHIGKRTDQLLESNAAVQHLAFHDPLTGLPNRALFEDRLDHALTVFRRTAEHRLALLYLDLDRFKAINDTLGHSAGDELICEFARRLSRIVKASDTVARLGGDEFAIIQVDSSPAEVEDLCELIVAEAALPFAIGQTQAHVGVSIGVALAGKHGLDIGDLARKADIALYEAKAKGRGQFRVFSPAMEVPIRARQDAERDLRHAIDVGGELSILYQPTYSARDGDIVGVEALLRWTQPENGNIPPSVFIPVAEETGLIEPLGEWVIGRACREAKDWPVETLSINVSPVQLRKPLFALRAIALISESGIDPAKVEFEITETAILEDTAQCSVNLRLLREFGIRIALDDFGTGYSSFRHFNDFEVDRVKIDRTFVDQINMAEGGSAIIEAMVNLARSSGFRTTAEGVETEEQRSFLKSIGCDELQGFLMARPIAPGEIDDLLGLTRDPAEAADWPARPNDRRVAG